jgi:hypothetical protein
VPSLHYFLQENQGHRFLRFRNSCNGNIILGLCCTFSPCCIPMSLFCPLCFQDLDKERLEAETELSILRQSLDEKLQIELQRKVVFDMKVMGIYAHAKLCYRWKYG